MKELMELVNAGKVDPIPVEQRPISDVNAALADLKDGKVLGRPSKHFTVFKVCKSSIYIANGSLFNWDGINFSSIY